MHTLFYTVVVKDKFLWLVRGDSRWRLGKFTLAGKLRLFSKKVELFLDADDIAKLEKDGKDEPEPTLVDSEGWMVKQRSLGSVEVLFAPLPDGEISIRIGGNDQERDVDDKSIHGDIEQWTEFATWTASKGVCYLDG